MTDKILTNLTEFPGVLSGDDWLYMVDRSLNTENADGSGFKIQVKNLGCKVLLQTLTNAAAGEFDFDNIPQIFNRIIIEGTVVNTIVATNGDCWAYLNADTTAANYQRQLSAAFNNAAQATEAATPMIASVVGSSGALANGKAHIRLVIQNYAVASEVKTMTSTFTTPRASRTEIYTGQLGVVSSITDAITRVRIRAVTHATDGLIGTMRLYGEM